jgi:hypothetical protein
MASNHENMQALEKAIAAHKKRKAAESYVCPNTKPEYGSKCSYLAGHNDDHTPCKGCPIFN